MGDVDFVQLAPQVGLHLLGKPTKQSSTEYRWGTNGSWCLNLETGLFFSFELDEGGGVIWLIDHFNQNRNDILNMYGSGFKDLFKEGLAEDLSKFIKKNHSSSSRIR